MKREIKFRGKQRGWEKHPDWGWFYGNLYVKDNSGRTHIGNIHIGCLDIDPQTVGQFTGLKDKNGKEIYEGDIVDAWSAGSHLPNGIIKWGRGAARFFIGNKQNSLCWNLSGGGANYEQETLEVIGNIHDNPELLEVIL